MFFYPHLRSPLLEQSLMTTFYENTDLKVNLVPSFQLTLSSPPLQGFYALSEVFHLLISPHFMFHHSLYLLLLLLYPV